jgi:Papain family cysteine protease
VRRYDFLFDSDQVDIREIAIALYFYRGWLMDRRIARMLAVFALAAMVIQSTPTTSAAQTPNAADTTLADPPETVYWTGWVDEDPAVELKRSVVKRHRAFLPVSVDLSSRMPEVGNQGHSMSCTAWASAYAARSCYTSTLEGRNVRQAANVPSPAYVFHRARPAGCERGMPVGRAIDVLKDGALSLAEFPFTDVCIPPPSDDIVARAHDFKVRGLKRVDISHTDDVKGQLAQGNPVIIGGFRVSTAFMKFRSPATFTEPVPPPNDDQGTHAMTIVGYDDRRQAFRLINSWSKNWGDRGYAWFSYDLLQSRVGAAYVLEIEGAREQAVVPPAPLPSPQPQIQPLPAPTPAPAPIPLSQFADLQTLSCGRVDVEARGNQSVLSGYVASDDDLKRVTLITASVPNASIGNIIVAPWPQCEALQTLAKPLQVADRPTIDIGARTELHGGDPLRIQIHSPTQISYLYVSYIQADGSVVHLVRPGGSFRSRRFRDKRCCSAAVRRASQKSRLVRHSAAR